MAGDWIKWSKGLNKRREVLAVSSRLNTSPAHVAGLCMIFWEWLDDNVAEAQIDDNGNAVVTLGALQPSFIDAIVGVSGFAAALSAEGWLHQRSGSLVVPNYSRHNGQTAKDRALTAERVAKHRGKKCNGESVTPVTVAALPEKRREEDKGSLSQRARTSGGVEGNPQVTPPTLEQVKEYAEHSTAGIPPECVEPFWADMSAVGWVDGKQRPIRDWRHALTAYANRWRANDFQRSKTVPRSGGNPVSGPPASLPEGASAALGRFRQPKGGKP